MATFVLIHGGAHGAWCWHLLEDELRARGHRPVAMDLPSDDEAAGLDRFASVAVEAYENAVQSDRSDDIVVVGHSLGGLTAPIVAGRLPTRLLVLLAAMVPAPGESAVDLWAATGFVPETPDPLFDDEGTMIEQACIEAFYPDTPRALAVEAVSHLRDQTMTTLLEPSPLTAWPDVTTRYLLCREDRMVPAEWARRVVPDRLGITPDEMDGSHSPFLTRPAELADRLVAYLD